MSSAPEPDAVSAASAAYTNKLNSIAPSAVLIQLALMVAISVVAVLGFSLLRPRNTIVYQPKVKYSEDQKAPPKISRGFFAWVSPLVSTTEESLVDTIGVDAAIFLRFLRMSRNIFLAVALLGICGLFPLDITYNLKNVAAGARSPLSIVTIQDVKGSWIWGHVAVTYLISFIIFIFIYLNFRAVIRLRKQWFRSPDYQNSLHSRSIMITSIDKKYQSDNQLAELLNSLKIPYPITACHIGRRVGNLPELIESHNGAVRALEAVLTTFFKDPNNLPSKRPTIKREGKRVDAIDYLTAKIQRLEQQVEVARSKIGDEKAENFGFAAFASTEAAAIVARGLDGKRKKGCRFELAPLPEDILWKNLTLSDAARTRNVIIGTVISFFFLVLYTAPLLFVSLLANLAALTTYLGFLEAWSTQQPFLFSAFAGVVPPLLSVLLQLLLPIVMRWIASFEGAYTHSRLDRMVTARFSNFLLFSQFFIFSLLSVLVQVITQVAVEIIGKKSIGDIWANLHTLPTSLQYTWVVQSTYWLTVFPLRGFAAVFDLAQVIGLLYIWMRTKLFGRTPREIREATKPQDFDYSVYYSVHILMIGVACVYAPLAPLVPLFASVAFAASVAVYKYQVKHASPFYFLLSKLMYVSVTAVETGGRLWPVAVNRILVAVVGMQALMLLTTYLEMGWQNGIAMIPPIALTLIFKIILRVQFDKDFRFFIPTNEELSRATLHGADARKNRLEKRFGDPSLHCVLFTPMLHKSIQHLLPTVYEGRVGESQEKMGSVMVDGATVGGLKFQMLEGRNLAFDRAQYLRHRDEDTMSVSTGAFGGKMEENRGGYFDERRQNYLAKGPQTPFEDNQSEYDLSRLPTRDGIYAASTENLILSQPPQYIPNHGARYSPNESIDYNSHYAQPEFIDQNYNNRSGLPQRYDDVRTHSPQMSRNDSQSNYSSTYRPYNQSFDSNDSSSYPPQARPSFIPPTTDNRDDYMDGNRRM